jgi:hypothetical protein
MEAALKPYEEQARKSYPDARARFLKGLPAKHGFFVVTRLPYGERNWSRCSSQSIESRRGHFGTHRQRHRSCEASQVGDEYSFAEDDLRDWVITGPDGSEEGNFVGKAIEAMQAERAKKPVEDCQQFAESATFDPQHLE